MFVRQPICKLFATYRDIFPNTLLMSWYVTMEHLTNPKIESQRSSAVDEFEAYGEVSASGDVIIDNFIEHDNEVDNKGPYDW